MYVRQIACFANSRKHLGLCFAGKQSGQGLEPAWLRPVSRRETHEISTTECKYQDGSGPQLLDLIRIPLHSAAPHGHQTENHLIDTNFYWVKTGRLHWQDLPPFVDECESLWELGENSRHGLHDRVTRHSAARSGRSLMLIRPERCALISAVEAGEFHPRVRAQFEYRGTPYRFPVTDMWLEEQFRHRPPGEYPIPECLLCVSLGECFRDQNCYKLCAAVITPKRAGTK